VRDYGVIRLLLPLLGGVVTTRERTSPLSTSPTCEERQAQLLLCPANCGCKNSLPRLAGKSRVVKDFGLRSGNAELISNTRIAEGEIVAVFGETATIWSQDDVREFQRIAAKKNEAERDVQKFQFYVSGSNPENQCHLHIVPCEDAEMALSMKITSSLRHSLQSRSERRGAIRESHMLQASPERRVTVHHCVCVLLCFIKPILGNRYGPGVNFLRQ